MTDCVKCFRFLVALASFVGVSLWVRSQSDNQSPDEGDAGESLSYEDLEQIVQNNVLNFLRLMEDLADYQVEPLTDEMTVFFRELALIAQAMKAVGQRESSSKIKLHADPDEPSRKKQIKQLYREVAALRSETRKNVKGILDRKQFRKYNNLIDKIAPLPSRRSTDLSGDGEAYTGVYR